MSASIRVDWDPGPLRSGGKRARFAVVRTLRKAGSTALRDMRSEATKRVRQRKRIKAGEVRKAMTIRRPRGNDADRMEWAVQVRPGRPMSLMKYPHRVTKKGVVVEVNRGKKTLLRSAFVATMASGHVGIFVRRGLKRLPIDERLGARPIDALNHPGEVDGILRRGRASFEGTYARLLPVELAKVEK